MERSELIKIFLTERLGKMKRFSVFIMSLIIIFISGCGGSNDLSVKLSTPKTFTPGKIYAMQITVLDHQGNPVEGVNVSADLTMKNMDHGTTPVEVEEIGDGKYIGTANLPMNGDWVAAVRVKHDGKIVEDLKQFSVEAKTMENAHKVTKDVALPEFNLMDENGNTVTKQDLLGKTVVMTFTYVNCADPNASDFIGQFQQFATGSENERRYNR